MEHQIKQIIAKVACCTIDTSIYLNTAIIVPLMVMGTVMMQRRLVGIITRPTPKFNSAAYMYTNEEENETIKG